jgi:phage shock protein C
MATHETNLKRLYRSRQQHMLAGVCGGLAEYFGLDVTVVRILWLLTIFLSGFGVLAYIICALLMKYETESAVVENPAPGQQKGEHAGRSENLNIFLLIIFFLILLKVFNQPFLHFPNLFHWHWGHGDNFLSILLIFIGVAFLITRAPGKNTAEGGLARVTRSRSERMLGGVCAGLAHHWQLDATLLRIGFVFLGLVIGPVEAMIAYLLLLIVIPEEKL